jgi:hypothetical protein
MLPEREFRMDVIDCQPRLMTYDYAAARVEVRDRVIDEVARRHHVHDHDRLYKNRRRLPECSVIPEGSDCLVREFRTSELVVLHCNNRDAYVYPGISLLYAGREGCGDPVSNRLDELFRKLFE